MADGETLAVTTGRLARDRVRDAAANVLERLLTALVREGQVQLKGRPGATAVRMADALEEVGLLSLTGETAIALELVSSGWPPVANDLAEASIHGIHLGGILLSGQEDHVADYLRVVEAQHEGISPRPLDHYRTMARGIRQAYHDASPATPLPPTQATG